MSETKATPASKKNSKKRRRLTGWYVQQHARAERRKDARVLKLSNGLVHSVQDSIALERMDSLTRLNVLNDRRKSRGLKPKFYAS